MDHIYCNKDRDGEMSEIKPHWINITGRTKGQKFRCSNCKGECHCITYGNSDKYGKRNICDYEYCPRCGKEMDLTTSFIIEKSEKRLEAAGEEETK